MEIILIILVLLAVLVIAGKIAKAAEKKARSGTAFFWLSFLLFPIGAIIAMFIIAATKPPTVEEQKHFAWQQLVDGFSDLKAIPPGLPYSQIVWAQKVTAKMIEMGSFTEKELQEWLDTGKADRDILLKFVQLEDNSPEFAEFLAGLKSSSSELEAPTSLGESAGTVQKVESRLESSSSPDDVISQIQKLVEWKAAGMLNQQEFEEAKRRVLGS